ncbi:MAG: stalk domain-containing protein, partial [Ezakiella sp.]|nr:stalk domain-containing protein [Ezakiella sp.]
LTKFNGEIKLFLNKNGNKERIDQKMQDGLRVVNGRTCIGVRDLVNAIEGAEVNWDGTNKIVDITYNGKNISYPLNKPVMWDGDKMVTIDVPAQVDPSIERTFLPIRNIAETLGFKVDWNQKTKEVTLTPGAGTTQQPRANTNKGAVTKGGAYTLANGKTLPRINNLPKEPTGYYLSEADFTDNGDGTMTFAKGSEWEATFPKPSVRVDSSPAKPDFKILGDNGPDNRMGTAVLMQGNPLWERVWQYVEDTYGSGDHHWIDKAKGIKRQPHFEHFTRCPGAFEEFEALLAPRKIKQQYVDDFFKNGKHMKYKGELNAMRQPLADDDFYDATGIIDPGFDGHTYTYYVEMNPLSYSDNYIITTTGEYYSNILDRNNKNINIEVDKILAPYRGKTAKISWLVIDVPNFKYKAINPYNNEDGVVGVSLRDKAFLMRGKFYYDLKFEFK